MNRPALRPLFALLGKGSCAPGDDGRDDVLNGLAYPGADGERWIVSQRLLRVRETLSSDGEAVAALLATRPEIRAPWLRLLAARCREAGRLDDANALVQLVTHLDGAAAWVEQALPDAALQATKQTELERELLGVPADQARAVPALVRALAAAHRLSRWQAETLPILQPVDRTGNRPDRNWCSGRLIGQPPTEQGDAEYLLSGCWRSDDTAPVMDWVLATPWAFLLAMLVFVQDAWAAEARGGLLLELPAGQQAERPAEIQVLVAGRDSEEVLCGTLAGFLLRLLSRLNMGLFPGPLSEAELNRRLAPLIGELLGRRVWRYRDGLSGEQGFYQIHPEFSDACYQIAGARSFGLYGRDLRQAIREQAEQWRIDRQDRVHQGAAA